MKKLRVTYYILILVTCTITLFPFYWLLITSLQSVDALFSFPPKFLPTENFIHTYTDYIRNSKISTWLLNSFLVSIIATGVSTLFAIPAGYSISRFRFKGKTMAIFTILLTQMLPPVLLVIPIYIIFAQINLTNTLYALMIIYTALTLPIGIWFLKGFFDSIPKEMEESATIDGCSRLEILTRIHIPLLRPGIVATATWSFIIAWDEYLFAYTMIESDQLWPVSVGLASYIGQYSTPWNKIMAGAVLGTLPAVIMFMYFQRYLVSGLTAGSVKG